MRWIPYAYEALLDPSSCILQMFLSTLLYVNVITYIPVSYTNTSPFCSVLLAGLLNYWGLQSLTILARYREGTMHDIHASESSP